MKPRNKKKTDKICINKQNTHTNTEHSKKDNIGKGQLVRK